MINSKDFPGRLQKIMDYYDLNASAFADRLGVQRSAISHILSGRNKPSLDFVLKLSDAFAEVNLYWLLLGKGSFLVMEEIPPQAPAPLSSSISREEPEAIYEKNPPLKDMQKKNSRIVKVIVLYENGRFDSFEN